MLDSNYTNEYYIILFYIIPLYTLIDEKGSRFVKFKSMDSKKERRGEKVGRYKLKDILMGGNNAVSFSKMEKCFLPLKTKSWLLAGEKRKIGRR